MREAATGAVAEAEVVWQGSDGALDQDIEELMPEGPQRSRLDWKNLGKYAPDVDDPRRTPMPADRATLRRRRRASCRRGYLRPPLPVDTVVRIFELRDGVRRRQHSRLSERPVLPPVPRGSGRASPVAARSVPDEYYDGHLGAWNDVLHRTQAAAVRLYDVTIARVAAAG